MDDSNEQKKIDVDATEPTVDAEAKPTPEAVESAEPIVKVASTDSEGATDEVSEANLEEGGEKTTATGSDSATESVLEESYADPVSSDAIFSDYTPAGIISADSVSTNSVPADSVSALAGSSSEAAGTAADAKDSKEKAKDKKVKKPEGPINDTSNIKEGMDWYVVHVYSGFEQKAKLALMDRIKSHKMEQDFGGCLVPQEQVVEMVRGQKKTTTKKFYPGYMIVQMAMNRDTWHLVKETPKVSGFVGDATSPDPLTSDEVARLLQQVTEGSTTPRASMTFHQGESIKVVDGPFVDFNGTVDEVRPEKGKLRVLISIFGRATPVELDFAQVERIS